MGTPVDGTRMTGAEVAVVITALDPDEHLLHAVSSVIGQVGSVVVVDDGSTAPEAAETLVACAELGCTVLRHGRNLGIAAALNTGVSHALAGRRPPRAVLTLDQDSKVSEGYVAAVLTAWERAENAGVRVAMVGPERVNGRRVPIAEVRDGVPTGAEPIQSGLLVPGAVLREVGPFDEGLFIDGVDTDFYLRCLDTGRAVVLAPGTDLEHRLGARHAVTLAGRAVTWSGAPVELTASAPFRYYYLVRNRVVLVTTRGRRHPRWALGQLVGLVGHLALVLAFVPGRAARARWARRGLRDGVRKVSGPAPRS